MSMGLYPGQGSDQANRFVLKGPVMIKVGRSTIALGHDMAGKVKVQVE